MAETSTKPYLLRAIYEWCTDNGYTPYLAAVADGNARVPKEFVKNGEIVLNISFGATSGLKMDNDVIHFNARFGGISREISVPIENVVAIYARENGQGMAFPVPGGAAPAGQGSSGQAPEAADRSGMVLRLATDRDDPAPVPAAAPAGKNAPGTDSDPPPELPPTGGRPALKRIK